ncbi:hypothetical protein FXW27_01280 [Candidatus Liberibacter asiaticus]|nr:hypothetical protein FXW31_02880 [Candidatus Liberibacter asiaticus]KAE9516766.1 hypothetical protein FXW27_01280 [Candidatus Liberibacter asiaticus]
MFKCDLDSPIKFLTDTARMTILGEPIRERPATSEKLVFKRIANPSCLIEGFFANENFISIILILPILCTINP